jgi:NIPSNAP protein
MLLDVRTYVCKPGTLGAHLNLYDKMGREPQVRHLGEPLLYMLTETGDPNEYVHIWTYENAGDREAKRAAMWADPEWLAYVAECTKLGALAIQSNKLMKPVDFFPEPR